MAIASAVVVYIILWWLVLFAVLPWGVHRHGEAGVPDRAGPRRGEAGWDPGAPSNPNLWRKALWTTVIAAVLWCGVYAVIESDWLPLRMPY